MKQKQHTYFQLILSLLLVISLLTGCFVPSAPSLPEASASESSQQDAGSTDSQNAPAVQAAFSSLTRELFLDEVSQDLLVLHYTLANPASYGITDYPKTFEPVSADTAKQAISDAKSLRQQLNSIDSRLLTQEQLLTYTILSSYVNTLLSGEGFELYEQPLSSALGVQAQLPIILSEYTFYSKQDVEDYLTLLSSIDEYFKSICEFEKQKAEKGLGLCNAVIDRILDSCSAYLLDADHNFLTQTFENRLNELPELTEEEKQDYLARNHRIMNEHFVPAYEALVSGLKSLKGTEGNDKGLFYLPQGQEYYQYLVNLSTGTSYPNIPALKKAISDQMHHDLAAMDEILAKQPQLAEQLQSYSFDLTEPEKILHDLQTQCSSDFPPIDQYTCSIKDVPKALEQTLSPAFYLTVPIDRPEDNSIYINYGSTDSGTGLYSTLAHEGYPGHMYQNLYFNQNNSCDLRKLLGFPGYSEGWATYAEYYSYELENGLAPELGSLLRHNSAFTLALYALLDINIHYEGWDIKQVSDYLNQYFLINDLSVITTIYYDIAENPANYLTYYTGYLEIITMQQEAQKTLGKNYSDLEFNRFLLDMGPAPFGVIKMYFSQWMQKMQK